MDGNSPSLETGTTSETDTNNNNQVCVLFLFNFHVALKLHNDSFHICETHIVWHDIPHKEKATGV